MREACVSVTDYSFCKLNFISKISDIVFVRVLEIYFFCQTFYFLSNKRIDIVSFISMGTVLFLELLSYCKNDFTYTAFNFPAMA